MSLDLDELLARLESADREVQMRALEETAEAVQKLTARSLDILERTTAFFPVCERLMRFGATLTRPLEEKFAIPMDSERKTHVAMLLLYLGSRVGVEYLLTELAEGGEMAVAISIAISSAGIAEAAPLIEALLLQWDLVRDPWSATTLIICLKKLRWRFSTELIKRLSIPSLPRNIQLALGADSPPQTVQDS
jgi:hypothetical protein